MLSDDTVKELSSFTPNTLITLYEIDVFGVVPDVEEADSVFYFYNGTNFNFQNLVFDGEEYVAIPMETEGFGRDSQRPTRPLIRMANIRGMISEIINDAGGIEGSKVTRKRVFLKNIDAANFPDGVNPFNPAPDPTDRLNDDIFLVNRKSSETQGVVEWELSMPIDLENSKFPSNQILANVCRFRYRGEGCRYSGVGYLSDIDGNILGNCGGWSPFSRDKLFGGYSTGDIVMVVESGEQQYYRAKLNITGDNLDQALTNTTYWERIQASLWNNSSSYSVDDIVYYTNSDGINDHYVCIKAHNSANGVKYNNSEYWVKDKCGKTLGHCNARFSGNTHGLENFRKIGINFGGYLGVQALPIE